MVTTIQSIHFDADAKLLETIEAKVAVINKYLKSQVTEVKVFLKLEKIGQIQDKIIEILVHLPGQFMVVKSTSKTFEAALKEAMQSLKNQIRKYNGKQQLKH